MTAGVGKNIKSEKMSGFHLRFVGNLSDIFRNVDKTQSQNGCVTEVVMSVVTAQNASPSRTLSHFKKHAVGGCKFLAAFALADPSLLLQMSLFSISHLLALNAARGLDTQLRFSAVPDQIRQRCCVFSSTHNAPYFLRMS